MADPAPSANTRGLSAPDAGTPDDDALAALLRSGDPWRNLAPEQVSLRTDDVGSMLAHFGEVGQAVPVPTRRHRRRTFALAGLGSAVFVGLGSAALALGGFTGFAAPTAPPVVSAWTGTYAQGTPDGQVWEDGVVVAQNGDGTDTSEMVNGYAPDGPEVVAGLAPTEIPLPTWTSWDEVIDYHLAQMATQSTADRSIASARTYRSYFNSYADTAWKTQWVEAFEAGDVALADEALTQWLVVLDDNRDVWGSDQVEIPYELLAAAEFGDVAAVRHNLEIYGPRWITARIGITAEMYHQ